LCFRRWFRFRRNSAAAFRLVAARGVLRRRVRRRRICPRGNNVFKAAAGGTTGKQRRQNRYRNKSHHDEGSRLDAHPNAEKLGPGSGFVSSRQYCSGGFPDTS